MSEKVLYIHAGGSKAGSSALQNFFELNAAQLESLGFAYENKLGINSEYQITSGNGLPLVDMLLSEAATDDEIDNFTGSYFGQYTRAICSSESFVRLGVSHWQKLLESSVRLGATLKVIFYVRNVIPFLLSSYDQALKRHGESRLFEEWAAEAVWQHYDQLAAMCEVLPLASVQVLHYDSSSKNLIPSFLEVLGVGSVFEPAPKDLARQVNRSLIEEEREVLRLVNKVLGAACSSSLSDFLIYANPEVKGDTVACDQTLIDRLTSRFNGKVEWVNHSFFNSQGVVSVMPVKLAKKNQGKKDKAAVTYLNNIPRLTLDWAIGQLQTIQENTTQVILNNLTGFAQKSFAKMPSEVPNDFDPLHYLLLNDDVLRAGVDPIAHFIQFGRGEGRAWKIANRSDLSPTLPETGSRQQEIAILRNNIDTLTQAVKQWQTRAKEISDKAAARERELFLQLEKALGDRRSE